MEQKPLTLQDVFDKNWQYFIVENKPFGYIDFHCTYLGSNGEKCAIGVCIPEEIANKITEHNGCNVSFLLSKYKEVSDLFDKNIDFTALSNLQHLHDDCAKECADAPIDSDMYNKTHSLYKKMLTEFAEKYNLILPS